MQSSGANQFKYLSYQIDAANSQITCNYQLADYVFTEKIEFLGAELDLTKPAVISAAKLMFLLLGISYYKTQAPDQVDFGDHQLSAAELTLLTACYTSGLREFEYQQPPEAAVILDALEFIANVQEPSPIEILTEPELPLIPFGGGIDSVVTVTAAIDRGMNPALFISSYAGKANQVLDRVAAVTELPEVRVNRYLDEKVLTPKAHGFRTGHIPVTGLLSSIAVVAALAAGKNSVIMSNEWSASSPNLVQDGIAINHQWSKSFEFEQLFQSALKISIPGFKYYSYLRERSELWVGQEFAKQPQYHSVFLSCNRGFHVDPAQRASTWCSECDKCCFINLILGPQLSKTELAEIFNQNEPLENPALADQFLALLGDPKLVKPFECVGDQGECRTALQLLANRADRKDSEFIQSLLTRVQDLGLPIAPASHWLSPLTDHFENK